MDRRLTQDAPQGEPQAGKAPAPRRFAAVEEDHDAMYPMLAPAAAVAATSEEDLLDVQPNAGLVNV